MEKENQLINIKVKTVTHIGQPFFASLIHFLIKNNTVLKHTIVNGELIEQLNIFSIQLLNDSAGSLLTLIVNFLENSLLILDVIPLACLNPVKKWFGLKTQPSQVLCLAIGNIPNHLFLSSPLGIKNLVFEL